MNIIDLGASPGSWSQALARQLSKLGTPFKIIAVDKQSKSISRTLKIG